MIAASRFARTSMQTSLGSAISAQRAATRCGKAPPASPGMGRRSVMRVQSGPDKRSQRDARARRREMARRLAEPQRAVPARQLL
eukprot:6226061-Pyramimonas_sp.AAC.1